MSAAKKSIATNNHATEKGADRRPSSYPIWIDFLISFDRHFAKNTRHFFLRIAVDARAGDRRLNV